MVAIEGCSVRAVGCSVRDLVKKLRGVVEDEQLLRYIYAGGYAATTPLLYVSERS
jgi:hypothetical protein